MTSPALILCFTHEMTNLTSCLSNPQSILHMLLIPPLMTSLTKKSSTYDVTHKKNALPRQKIFFRVQSTRLADLF